MNIYFDEKRIKTFYTTIPKRLKNLRKEHQVQILLKIGHINPGLYQAKISIEGIQVPNKILGQPAIAQTPIKIEKAQIRTTARRKIIVEKIKGETGISIVTPNIKQIYKEMEERRKREIKAWREGW